MNKFRIYDDEFKEYEHLVIKSLVEDFNVIDDRGPKFYTAESLVLQGSYILLADLNDDISPIESAKNLIEMKLEIVLNFLITVLHSNMKIFMLKNL